MANSRPVSIASDQTGIPQKGDPSDYMPRSSDMSQGGGNTQTDPDGNLNVRGTILTDEGGYRVNFANSALGISLGTCTLTNGSTAATGTFSAPDLHVGDYVKLDADAETAWVQIERINNLTSITLVSAYTGTGGTGAASRTIVAPSTGAGDAIAVASGALTITKGTTSGAVSDIERMIDVLPIGKQTGFTISQRIANQDAYIGLIDAVHSQTPWWYAWFRFTGTVNTTVLCESGFNPSGVPSASEVESQSVTIPNAGTTATAHRYRVEALQDKVRFFIDGYLVKELFKSVPHSYNVAQSVVRCTNTGIPASATTITVDYDTCKNENRLAIGGFSEQELFRVTSDGLPTALGQTTSALSQPCVLASDQRGMALASPMYVRTTDGTSQQAIKAASTAAAAADIAAVVSFAAANCGTKIGDGTNAAAIKAASTAAATADPSLVVSVAGANSAIKLGDGTNNAAIKAASTAAAAADPAVTVTLSPNLPVPTLHTLESAATTNATSVKASAGRILSLVLTSPLVTASVRFFKLYNLATAPTVGTSVPVITIPFATTATNGGIVQINCSDLGLYFSTGIAYAITGLSTTADTTAVAAGDVKVFINYI